MQPEAVNFQPVDPGSQPLLPADWALLNNVETAITQGHDMLKWWTENCNSRVKKHRHPVARQIHSPDDNYGFLMNADLRLGSLPVAGVIQDQLFSFPKARHGKARDLNEQRRQLRAFTMNHLLHCASSAAPRACGLNGPSQSRVEKDGQGGTPSPLDGWQYRQIYYRLKNNGCIGKFSETDGRNPISLDEVGKKYAWVVFKCIMHKMEIPFGLAGTNSGPRLTISMTQPVFGVMTPEFLMNEDDPEPGVIGRYGYGNSVVPDPNNKSLMAAGPGSLSNAIETLHFRLLDTGEIRARSQFIMPQPDRMLKLNLGGRNGLPLDPVFMALNAANILTLGLARDEFSLSRNRLTKTFMEGHFSDVRATLNLLGSHFGMVADWTDTANLPDWARTGYESVIQA